MLAGCQRIVQASIKGKCETFSGAKLDSAIVDLNNDSGSNSSFNLRGSQAKYGTVSLISDEIGSLKGYSFTVHALAREPVLLKPANITALHP